MQQGDAPFEWLLHRSRARYRKMYCAQLIRGQILVVTSFICQRPNREQHDRCECQRNSLHASIPLNSEFIPQPVKGSN
jgi:hypothetical protein